MRPTGPLGEAYGGFAIARPIARNTDLTQRRNHGSMNEFRSRSLLIEGRRSLTAVEIAPSSAPPRFAAHVSLLRFDRVVKQVFVTRHAEQSHIAPALQRTDRAY